VFLKIGYSFITHRPEAGGQKKKTSIPMTDAGKLLAKGQLVAGCNERVCYTDKPFMGSHSETKGHVFPSNILINYGIV
jgi:hypothetical protein